MGAHNPQVMAAFNNVYLIRLNVDEWGYEGSGSGLSFDMVPAFFRLDEQGKPTGDMFDGTAWDLYTPAEVAQAMGPWLQKP